MSLIELVVGVALLLTVFLALFGILRASLALSSLAKAKAVAVELASSQMEYLRSVPYSSLGTVGGTPNGLIPSVATSTVGGAAYPVYTTIRYVDDPADGSGGSDANNVTTDYKKAQVTVRYTANGHENSLTLVSNFAPNGMETP